MVEATLSYLADMPERPAYYLYEPPPDAPPRESVEVRTLAFFAPLQR